jgi:uncharacterized protein (TIGR03118 family)
MKPWQWFSSSLAILTATVPARANAASGYAQVNLVSDIPLVAASTDSHLVNPWGMASSPTSPIWVSDNGTGVATLYNGAGTAQALVVSIPPPSGGTPPSTPTGVVFNPTNDFSGDRFLFATEDGTIAGWRGSLGTNAELVVDNSSGAVYKGLALGNNGTANHLYATNFHAATVDVFDANFAQVTLGGNFVDPNLPAGFAPFGIQNIGGILVVTYARQDVNKHDDVPGPGNGYVDEFDMDGNLLKRLVSAGVLNSPWGLAMAPAGFGDLSGDLLVGNFGDGRINAFDASTGAFLDTLNDSVGNPIIVQGLWALLFGNGGNGGAQTELFFSAGIPGSGSIEDHGLFGKFAPNIPDLVIAKSHSGDFAQGQVGAAYSLVITNSGGVPTSGMVSVVDTLPAGLSATAITGTGWSCNLATLTCIRSDALGAGASYPPITLTVDVDPQAPATLTNTATVSGGGETYTLNDTATDSTTVTPPLPDPTIAKTHTGDFVRGQKGATYSLIVTNNGALATSGTVTVVDTLPAGLSATAITGTGWSCNLATLTCVRSDALGAGASYPPITLIVNVDPQASAILTNTATVSGGGETYTLNDTADDPTRVGTSVPIPTLQGSVLGLLGLLLAAAGVFSLHR